MSDGWILVGGAVAAVCGVNTLEHARAGRHFRPGALLGALVAAFLASEHGERFQAAEGWLRFSGWALVFCAMAPLLGYVLYGRNGRIIRLLGRVLLFALLMLGTAVVLWLYRLEPRQALLAGLITAVTMFLPWSGLGRRWRRWRHRCQEQRREKRDARLQAREQRLVDDDRKTIRELRRQLKRSSRALQAQEQRLAALERGEHHEHARLDVRREEVLEQVRMIRAAEVERIKEGSAVLELQSDYGFLMAETWRVLRAEIESGQRTGALEHDAFFFQVLEGLLAAPDFERRYLHETGRLAVAAVNEHLKGGSPLADTAARLASLDWAPDLLAPTPVHGELVPGLLEAWLVPHRRRQDLDWQLFCAGDHPQQEQLADFFDEIDVELPTRDQWRQWWDECPSVFIVS